MVKLNLESRGPYTVIEESNPLQAINTAHQSRPDMIFLDIMMPGLDGGEVASRLKSVRSLKDIPVVFLTAIASKNETKENQLIGGIPLLAKPISADDMIACIKQHLGDD